MDLTQVVLDRLGILNGVHLHSVQLDLLPSELILQAFKVLLMSSIPSGRNLSLDTHVCWSNACSNLLPERSIRRQASLILSGVCSILTDIASALCELHQLLVRLLYLIHYFALALTMFCTLSASAFCSVTDPIRFTP